MEVIEVKNFPLLLVCTLAAKSECIVFYCTIVKVNGGKSGNHWSTRGHLNATPSKEKYSLSIRKTTEHRDFSFHSTYLSSCVFFSGSLNLVREKDRF
ncbi:hypothetical protein AVEN_153727-1 [Araneus ventricosus]|uniref:Uncharacterized protein n=1 Tax=Araneus ventricosus TaxID=182803 RepID=A0A4Y2W3X0_ARAVE|nr:hypothetical protein AVEN_153727-1 [Araneus ventricosus]